MNVLIQIQESDGSYAAIAGIRASSITMTRETVEQTVNDLFTEWATIAAVKGVRSVSCSGSGVLLSDSNLLSKMNAMMADGEASPMRLIIEGRGAFLGDFYLNSVEFQGSHNGAAAYRLALSSSGVVNFEELDDERDWAFGSEKVVLFGSGAAVLQ